MLDYKSMCAAATICATLVNIQTHMDPWVDRGTCPCPLLYEVEETPCVCLPYFLGVDIFVLMHTVFIK